MLNVHRYCNKIEFACLSTGNPYYRYCGGNNQWLSITRLSRAFPSWLSRFLPRFLQFFSVYSRSYPVPFASTISMIPTQQRVKFGMTIGCTPLILYCVVYTIHFRKCITGASFFWDAHSMCNKNKGKDRMRCGVFFVWQVTADVRMNLKLSFDQHLIFLSVC